MRLRRHTLLTLLVSGLALVSAFAAKTTFPAAFARSELALFDAYQRAAPWRPAEPQTRIVDIDEESLRRLGQWPWPRSTLAELTRALQDLGVRALAYDVVFAEPDRSSPARLAAEWRRDYGAQWLLGDRPLPDFDRDFADALARGRAVLGFGLIGEATRTAAKAPAFAVIGGDALASLPAYAGVVAPLPELQAAAAGVGAFTMAASRDEIVRRLPLVFAAAGRLAPAFALEALRVGSDEDTLKLRVERVPGSSAATGLTMRVGELDIPLDSDGAIRLHFGPRDPRTVIPAWKLVDADARAGLAADLRDKIAFIGASAVGLSDLRATPLNPLEPGVNIHALAVEQALAGHFLTRPAWAPGAEAFAAVALSAALALLALAAPPALALAGGAATLAAVVAGGFLAFARADVILDTTFPAFAAGLTLLATLLTRYFASERDARKLRSAFSLYLAPPLVEALARDPSRLKLGGELKELSFVFTDLEGFTQLAEAADPRHLVQWLNVYLDGLCGIAMEHGGIVDKIVGDAVHVIFNAPLDQPDHARRAVLCALALDAFAQAYSAELNARGVAFGATRIGVNTGLAVVGNFGGERRFDYTAHGDAINTAARLEAANKALGTRICVAQATLAASGVEGFAPVGTLSLKGKSQGVEVFTPGEDAWREDYCEAYALLQRGDARGRDQMLRLARKFPDAPPIALQARRLAEGQTALALSA